MQRSRNRVGQEQPVEPQTPSPKIGDKTSAAELQQEVIRLLSERPMTLEHLAEATGARLVRVARAVAAIRKHPETRDRIKLIGDRVYRSGWFLFPR
jgi:hypothetical protein